MIVDDQGLIASKVVGKVTRGEEKQVQSQPIHLA